MSQGRRFTFFEKDVVKDPETGKPLAAFQSLNITAATSGRGSLILGDSEGFIHQVSQQFQISSFQGFAWDCTFLLQLKTNNILVGLGSDEEGINPLVKIWNFDKVDRGGAPQLLRTIKVVRGRAVPVSTLAASEDLKCLAVGLYDGSVLLYGDGDFTRERMGLGAITGNKGGKLVHEGTDPVTGLAFRNTGRELVLFVVTSSKVLSYCVQRKDNHVEELDSIGSEIKCSVAADVANGLAVARTEGVYAYEQDARGFALGVEGEKKLLTTFRNYLVIVGREQKRTDASVAVSKVNTLTIYDPANKFIAFGAGFNDIQYVLTEWNTIYILAGDGKVYTLTEKDFQTKLDMLFKKHLYDIAISLAKNQASETNETEIEIYEQYASHLYSKGNYNEAIAQYIKTIGRLEPSYVIRKFLDSQRIHNLTAYLKALHDKELADKHHTTLLLNCYTKLKDRNMLDEFIMTDRNLNFDLETAIVVCRQAGYYTHAVFLAKKFKNHDWYLKIQIEDEKHFQEAVDYIGTLPFEEAERNLKTYGKELVNEVPESTTTLLTTLCTGYTPTGDGADGADGGGTREKARPEEFIHIYVNQAEHLLKFLEHITTVQPNSATQIYDTLLELYLQSKMRETNEEQILDLLRNPEAKYDDHHAMVLAQIYDFKPGILYLYEKAKQYQQIVQYYMEKDAYPEIIDACKKYGTGDRQLWVQALSYFAGKEEDCKAQISEVLTHIDKRNLLPPLLVIDALARNSTATLSVVKEYIIKRLQQENHTVTEDERRIAQYREDTQRMRGEIDELKSKAKVFQDTKCSCCPQPLELPAVHFLCGHSFNQDCLPPDLEDCPMCHEERQKVKDIVRSQVTASDQHEQFFKQLEGSKNRFGVVADYFGKGVFNKLTLVTDAPAGAARGGPPDVPQGAPATMPNLNDSQDYGADGW